MSDPTAPTAVPSPPLFHDAVPVVENPLLLESDLEI